MNNFLGRLSRMGDAFASKSGNIMNNVRKSVGLLTAATALSMGTGAMAGEWHTVDTRGIGPEAFATQKFGNKDWKSLVDENGKYVLNPSTDLILGRKYTQKTNASGQSKTTTLSASRIISTPRPQPKPEAQINIVSIGENSKGKVEKGNTAQTNSLTGPKKDRIPTKEFKIPENFDSIDYFPQKTTSQDTHPRSEGRVNMAPICENPNTAKNSRIMEISNLDTTELFINKSSGSAGTQMRGSVPGNIFSIEEARALRKPPENITSKQYNEKPRVIEKQSFLKKLFGREHGENLGLDLDAYKEAISQVESGNKSYAARNDAIGKIKKIKPNKWAWGKYQFTTETLSGYGVSLKENGKISEKRVQEFLNDPDRQEGLMNEYIKKGLEIIKGKGALLGTIEEGKKPLPAILAKGHIAGHGSMDKNEIVSKNGKKKTDWLKTPISKYAKIVSDTYLSIIAKKEVTPKITGSENTIPKIQVIQPEFKMPTPTIQESKELVKPAIQAIGSENRDVSSLILAPELEQITITTPSANDTIFATQQVTQSVISPIDEKRIQIAKLSDIAQEHLKIAKDHRTEATRLRKESSNRFGHDWEMNRKRLNKRAEAHETNAEAHENRANALNNTIMRMSNNQPLEKAA